MISFSSFIPEWIDAYAQMMSDASEQDLQFIGTQRLTMDEIHDIFYQQPINRWDRLLIVDGRLAGDVNLFFAAEVAEINIFISQAYRGRGLGRMMIDEALEECRQKSKSTIYAVISADNQAAINLFNKYGFKAEAISGISCFNEIKMTYNV